MGERGCAGPGVRRAPHASLPQAACEGSGGENLGLVVFLFLFFLKCEPCEPSLLKKKSTPNLTAVK